MSKVLSIKLTVAIPTYNRKESLAATVKALLPQLVDGVELLIVDNASDYSVMSMVMSIVGDSHFSRFVRIVRNKYNVGANANIMRCIELAESPWVWLLSDDDKPRRDAVSSALASTIDDDIVGTCFRSRFSDWEEKRLVANSVTELFSFPKKEVGGLLFMSSWVVNVNRLTKGFRFGMQYTYTNASHLILVLNALKSSGCVVLSDKSLVDWGKADEGWSGLVVYHGLSTLCEHVQVDDPVRSRKNVQLVLYSCMPYWAYLLSVYRLSGTSDSYVNYMLCTYRNRVRLRKNQGWRDFVYNPCAYVLSQFPVAFVRRLVGCVSKGRGGDANSLYGRL